MQEVLDPDDRAKRCDLLIALGEALHHAGEPRRVLDELAPTALALAEELDDRERASRACQLAIGGIHTYGGGDAWSTQEAVRWTELADRFGAAGTADRVWVEHARACVSVARNDPGDARAAATRGREHARSLGDPVLQWIADTTWLYVASLYTGTPQLAQEALVLAEDLAARSPAGVSAQVLAQAIAFEIAVFLKAGLISLPGYTANEKFEIARRYLVPRQMEANGLKPGQASIEDAAVKAIIQQYTREAGVRSLEREIGRALRHAATRIAEGEAGPIAIRPTISARFSDSPIFEDEVAMRVSVPGSRPASPGPRSAATSCSSRRRRPRAAAG